MFGGGGLASMLVRESSVLLSGKAGDHELEVDRLRKIVTLLDLDPYPATGTLRFTAVIGHAAL